MQDHRKLRVWRHAHDLALAIRDASNSFPRTGYASLRSQTTRAAESIVFNIVEGCGTTSQRDFARFLDMSIRSSLELEAQLELARDYEIIDGRRWSTMTTQTIGVRRMLWGLRAKVIRSATNAGDSTADAATVPLDQQANTVRRSDR